LDELDDLELVYSVATAWFTAETTTLDHTDLLRIIVALASEGVGAAASPDVLLALLDLDEPRDRDLVRDACANFVTMWQGIGAVDATERLTTLGQWLLPRAFSHMWGAEFDEASD